MKKFIFFLLVIGFASIEVKSQTPITICPQSGSFSSMTRGYYFTAQTSFTICGIYVEDDMSTAAQSAAIVRFTAGAPPAYAATTNNFVTLFQSLNYVPNTMIAVPNITVNVGDIIGVYGSRGNAVNSYGAAQCVVNINATPHTLYRSGMQFNLATQPGMHDIWNENNGSIGRVTLYTNCCTLPTAVPSITGSTTACEGNTVTYSCAAQTGAISYNWTVPAGATINSGQGTNSISVTWNTTPGGNVCIDWTNNCGTSPQTCTNVTVNPIPAAPTAIGQTTCPNNAITLTATAPGGNYEWFDAAVGGNLLGTGASYTTPILITTTSYYVQTTVNGCVSPRTMVTVTVASNLAVDAGVNDTICFGGAVTLGATPNGAGYSYSWDEPGNLGFSTVFNPTVSPTVTTTYTVTVTDANNCFGTDSVTIFVNPPLTLNSSTTNITCNGACDGNITVTAAGGTGVYQYTIDGINFQASGSFNNLCAGNYVVGVVDDNACVDTVMLTLTDPALLVLDSIVNVDVSCNSANNGNNTDGSISVFATGGTAPLNYSIDNGATFSAANVFSGLSPGSYTVVVEDVNGCAVNGGNIVINEPAAISIPNVVTDVSCNGYNDGQIVVAPQGGTPAYSYSWSVNGVGNNPVANNLVAGNVTVTVSDANGCSEAITVTVNQPAPINFIAFSADVLSGCAPLAVAFYNATDTALIDSFYWDLGNGNIAVGDTTATVYSNPGTYDVSLFVTDNNGCPGVLTQTAYIEVFENPTANFSYSPLDVTLFDPLVYFTDLSLFNIASWQWNFANLGASAMQHPNFTFPGEDTASYPVTLLVTNDNGCTDSITKLVKINGETGVFVPNAFTPDGDNLNEFFAPQGFGVSPEGYAFLIFDRWGEVIFESYSPFDGWNGTYKGKVVQNGTYVWKLNYKDTNGKKFQNIGKVTIIY